MDFEGRWVGRRRPSSEWRFHRDILQARSDVRAVVHTHSRHATALACTGRGIPAFHYMVAVAGGRDIRCAPYHTFGTHELSAAALNALPARQLGPIPLPLAANGADLYGASGVVLPSAGNWVFTVIVSTSEFDATTTTITIHLY